MTDLDFYSLVALIVSALVGLVGLFRLRTAPARRGSESRVDSSARAPHEPPEPEPDTTIEELDDQIVVETADAIHQAAKKHDADPDVVKDLVAAARKERE